MDAIGLPDGFEEEVLKTLELRSCIFLACAELIVNKDVVIPVGCSAT